MLKLFQVWKGYHGNIYFEPIAIQKASASPAPTPAIPPIHNISDPLRQILARSSPLKSVQERLAIVKARQSSQGVHPRHDSANSLISMGSSLSSKPRAILDKRTVFQNPNNESLKEDLIWVAGQESTGSLRVETHHGQLHKEREVKSATGGNKDKICKGSVAHKIYAIKNRGFPFLSVQGDKYANPQRPSPLLQAQTTYSLSNQRMNMNSPDIMHPYGASYEKLPPLEQLRASLRHMDSTPSDVVHMIPSTAADRIREQHVSTPDLNPKPFVKYCPEVQNANNKQLQQQHVT